MSNDIESDLGGFRSQVIAEAQEELKTDTRAMQKKLDAINERLRNPSLSESEFRSLKEKKRIVENDIQVLSRVLAEVDFEELNSV